MTRALRQRLLGWFDRHRRDLPWRRTRDPYRIWLAEIMLQQTRVPVAVPYYERFVQSFPTVRKLARARLERVLRQWAGLGYYQRARHLHQAAKKIVREHRGRFPRSLEAALALPGVGAYTARAVLSIAYRQPTAVVDGNVARVLARVFLRRDADPDNRAAFQALADRLVSRRHPGDFNQAMMELGATVCLPRIPRCPACPLEKLCGARQAGLEQRFPRRQPQRPRPRVTLSVVVPRCDGRVLLVREAKGLFSGLWHFPYTRGNNPVRLGGARQPRLLATVEHQTTMRDLILRVYTAEASARLAPNGRSRWVRPTTAARLGIGAATRKILEAVANR